MALKETISHKPPSPPPKKREHKRKGNKILQKKVIFY